MNHASTLVPLRGGRLFRAALAFLCLGAAVLAALQATSAQGGDKPGVFKLTVVDESTGKPTPARIELLDEKNTAHVAADALLIGGD